ncbi:MAG: UPF0158 family protein [Flavobacteriales bacterium]
MAVFLDKSRDKIIKDIAQELDCGCDCFYNRKTHEIISIPHQDNMIDEFDFLDGFGSELEKINKNKAELIKFEVLESFESYKIMQDFTEQLSDQQLQSELLIILNKKKPFQNFKSKIDHSNYRQLWFNFKQNELEKRVRKQMDLEHPTT